MPVEISPILGEAGGACWQRWFSLHTVTTGGKWLRTAALALSRRRGPPSANFEGHALAQHLPTV